MNEEFDKYNNEMAKKYPNLYIDMFGDPGHTCMAWGITTPKGWDNIVEEASAKIEKEIVKLKKKGVVAYLPKAVQVKDKFASLRIYMNCTNKKIDKIIRKASRKSQKTCESCGKKGYEIDDNGWYRITCDNCLVGRYCVIAIYWNENYAETLACYIKAKNKREARELIEQIAVDKNYKVHIKRIHICDEFENFCADYRESTGKEPTINKYNWYKFKKRFGINCTWENK